MDQAHAQGKLLAKSIPVGDIVNAVLHGISVFLNLQRFIPVLPSRLQHPGAGKDFRDGAVVSFE